MLGSINNKSPRNIVPKAFRMELVTGVEPATH